MNMSVNLVNLPHRLYLTQGDYQHGINNCSIKCHYKVSLSTTKIEITLNTINVVINIFIWFATCNNLITLIKRIIVKD